MKRSRFSEDRIIAFFFEPLEGGSSLGRLILPDARFGALVGG